MRSAVGHHRSRTDFLSNGVVHSPVDLLGRANDFALDQTIFAADAPAKHLYKVQTGCVRTYVRNGRNRRTDLAFYFPGDYFGLEAEESHSVSAEAVSDSTLIVVPRAKIVARAANDLATAQCMIDITSRALRRAQESRQIHYQSADERVARFLLDLTKRFKRKDITLAMPRRDIADHLNITIETLSRVLTRLHNSSAISLERQRQVNVNFRKLA